MRLKLGAIRACPLPKPRKPRNPGVESVQASLEHDLEAWKAAKAAITRAKKRKR